MARDQAHIKRLSERLYHGITSQLEVRTAPACPRARRRAAGHPRLTEQLQPPRARPHAPHALPVLLPPVLLLPVPTPSPPLVPPPPRQGVVLNGDPRARYWGNVNLSFAYVEGESLLMGLKVRRGCRRGPAAWLGLAAGGEALLLGLEARAGWCFSRRPRCLVLLWGERGPAAGPQGAGSGGTADAAGCAGARGRCEGRVGRERLLLSLEVRTGRPRSRMGGWLGGSLGRCEPAAGHACAPSRPLAHTLATLWPAPARLAPQEVAVSSGSACTSASLEPSYVLRALGVEEDMVSAAPARHGAGQCWAAVWRWLGARAPGVEGHGARSAGPPAPSSRAALVCTDPRPPHTPPTACCRLTPRSALASGGSPRRRRWTARWR